MIQPLDESYFEKEENEQSGGIGSAKGYLCQNISNKILLVICSF
jgi:hypothetical protein